MIKDNECITFAEAEKDMSSVMSKFETYLELVKSNFKLLKTRNEPSSVVTPDNAKELVCSLKKEVMDLKYCLDSMEMLFDMYVVSNPLQNVSSKKEDTVEEHEEEPLEEDNDDDDECDDIISVNGEPYLVKKVVKTRFGKAELETPEEGCIWMRSPASDLEFVLVKKVATKL